MHDSLSALSVVLLVSAGVIIKDIPASLMQDELHLSPTEFGVLLSAFYYGYLPCMPATGWFAERCGAKAVLAAGVAVCLANAVEVGRLGIANGVLSSTRWQRDSATVIG